MKNIRFMCDSARMPLPGLNRGNQIDNLVLAAGVESVVTIPDGAKSVVLGGKNIDVWVNVDATATATGDVSDGTGSTYNDYIVDVAGADELNLISETGCRISLDWRK